MSQCVRLDVERWNRKSGFARSLAGTRVLDCWDKTRMGRLVPLKLEKET